MLTTEKSGGADEGFRSAAKPQQNGAQPSDNLIHFELPSWERNWSKTQQFEAAKLLAALGIFTAILLISNQLAPLFQIVTLTVTALVLTLLYVSLKLTASSPKTETSEAKLATTNELHDTLEHTPHGMAHWDDNAQLIWCNRAFRKLLGVKNDEAVIGKTYAEIMTVARNPLAFKAVNDDENHRIVVATCSDNKAIRIEDIADPSQCFVTMVTDDTEGHKTSTEKASLEAQHRKLAQQYRTEKLAAEAASRAKTSFLAHLSHDMRTPLNHIIGFADLIQHEPYGELGDKRYAGYVADIKRSGEALRDSFSDILELAELEAGDTVQKSESIKLDKFTDQCIRRHHARATRAGIRLEHGNLCDASVLGDTGLLRRLVDNLLDNAIRFTPEGGTILLNCWQGTDGVVLEITDTGIGMPREHVELLSQPFVLGESAFTKEHKGLGLGIATSRAIAELSGGELVIESNPGIGTTVAVTLPLAIEDGALENAA